MRYIFEEYGTKNDLEVQIDRMSSLMMIGRPVYHVVLLDSTP